jgi:hypothetical protein
MLFPIVAGAFLVFGSIGAIYFASPKRRVGFDQQFAKFTYAQAIVFAALPLTTPQWGWSIPMVPVALILAGQIIDRREDRTRQYQQRARQSHSDDAPRN